MSDITQYQHLNVFLAHEAHKNVPFHKLLKASADYETYKLKSSLEVPGVLYVKNPKVKPPSWAKFAESLTSTSIDELQNRSSSAVLIIRSHKATMAITFGYGRHLLDMGCFVTDFGIKTALNTLNHDTLRSIDVITLDEQGVQKKSQAARSTSVDVFGIDISKDLLRGVTGSPKLGIGLFNISGSGTTFSFGKDIDTKEMPALVDKIYDHYKSQDYKNSFGWVDNIRRLEEKKDIDPLNQKLLDELKLTTPQVVISIPEMLDWDLVSGFSFTRGKPNIKPTIESDDYFVNLDKVNLTVDSLKRDRLFVFDSTEEDTEYKLYDCLYFEIKESEKTYILFSGVWYEIAESFVGTIDKILSNIQITSLSFPKVYTWEETTTKGKVVEKIETEGDYNDRAAIEKGYYVLDKKLVKSDRTTTSIELCDLLTKDRQFVHVKHRKGGSAGLSHLFAQGNVAAEIMLGDRKFRKAARSVIRNKVSPKIIDTVPLERLDSSKVEVVFLILGEDSNDLKGNLPFFSKVNLTKAYENLSQKGFKVTIAGVGKVAKPTA
ncbi:TIGR04141 family sporadically distributed protein [Vibrio splendidus]|uniref:TIGR04141 family sporadically distributed protein n=1 Tax=Vibrio splendidus TaxID=29497 RepID=A0ABV4LL14_VIBSP